MLFTNPTDEALRAFLLALRTVAVVGLSQDPDRPSYSVAMYLQDQGYRIVPVRPGGGVILGEPVFERLTEIPFPLDVAVLFRASRNVAVHVDEAILMQAKAVWMQEGVLDDQAALKAQAAGLLVAMDRCLLKEHRRSGVGKRS